MSEPIAIINKLFLALQNVRFYPPAHSLVQESIANLQELLHEALGPGKEFSFGFIEQKLMVNGQTIEADPGQTKGLARHFEILHIDNITFQPGLTLPELRSFLECLSTKPEDINKDGGMKKALTSRNLRHILANDVLYGRITTEKEKESKPAKKPKSQIISVEEEDYLKALRQADANIPTGGSAFAAPDADNTRLPSPDELKELYAIRDRFQAEMDKRVQDATRHYETKNKLLTFEKNKMDSIMRHVGEGVVVVGNDGNILMANPAAEKLLGKQGRAVAGQPLKDTLQEEHSLVLASGSPDSIKEIEVAGKNDATRRVLRTSNAVIEDLDGRTIGMVSVLSDITKMKEVEQLKSDFVANVSHELRSPLAAIQKNLAIILDQTAGALNDDQMEFLSLAKDNVERLTRLINDLLDLSKIEAGKMELKKVRTDLAALTRNAVIAFTGWFKEKGLTAHLNLPKNPVELELDADKITQVLNNLLSNALKFSPPKGEIRVAIKPDDPVEVSVTDTGVGIAQKDIGRIFNKFEQVSGQHQNGANGTGLGLPLAKEIVEKHGGQLRVKSDFGKGSTFMFTLPVR
jgi:PAS domain S-box-containing protein